MLKRFSIKAERIQQNLKIEIAQQNDELHSAKVFLSALTKQTIFILTFLFNYLLNRFSLQQSD
ncbi:hypothetical protein NM22_06885 [Vibrio tubiashii]|nr:hypothetical protein NM22_06885 [Vibrio tubiashii]